MEPSADAPELTKEEKRARAIQLLAKAMGRTPVADSSDESSDDGATAADGGGVAGGGAATVLAQEMAKAKKKAAVSAAAEVFFTGGGPKPGWAPQWPDYSTAGPPGRFPPSAPWT